MNVFLRGMGLVGLLAVSGWVQAADEAPLLATGAWIRTPPPGGPVMAGYVELRNVGKREVRIAKLESPAFGSIEIHEMRTVNDVMRMRPVPELVVQPGDTVTLEPGGLHLMLFSPTAALAEGAKVTIDVLPEGAPRMSISFEVRDEAP